MAMQVQIDAGPSRRGMAQANLRPERTETSLQFWRRLIFQAVSDAKKTHCGVPTDSAILARWWLVENNPPRTSPEWSTSFEGACSRLDLDPRQMREKLLAKIEAKLKEEYELHVQSVVYVRRAMVLACAGIPTAIARQYVMPLVDPGEYDHIADVDHGDQFAMYEQRESTAA